MSYGGRARLSTQLVHDDVLFLGVNIACVGEWITSYSYCMLSLLDVVLMLQAAHIDGKSADACSVDYKKR